MSPKLTSIGGGVTMRLFILSAVSSLLIICCPPISAQQPGFNCRIATGLDEITICQSSDLAKLDRQLQGLYDTLQDRLSPSDKILLKETERRWLLKRSDCGTNGGCIASQYRIRINQLAALLAGDSNPSGATPASSPQPPAPASSGGSRPSTGSKDACDAFPTLC